jgi:orotidine-5'-phosphate decarboxylase
MFIGHSPFAKPPKCGALLRHAPVGSDDADLVLFARLSSGRRLWHNAAISQEKGMGMDDRLIVALDVPNALAGLDLAERLGDAVGFYKIGLGMLTGGGLALANELKQDHGKRIFLDMKLFDIGATVEAAVRGLAQFDLDFLTVHGDPHVVRAAKEGAAGSDLRILAVTILTSLERGDLDAGMMQPGDLHQITVERAARAFEAGADGVICSPREAQAIRALPGARLIVTPGVRPAGAAMGDQKRVETPASAIAAGADHIVVGRPVWQADDPRAAAQAILAEIGAPAPGCG